MKYEDVLKLITPDIIRIWCNLTHHHKTDISGLLWHYENSIKYGGELTKPVIERITAILFEAWIGFNQKSVNYYIDLSAGSCIIRQLHFSRWERSNAWSYKDFESNRSLLPPVQALICALVKAVKLEEKNNA